ncbi:hypothetical protein SCHPADRAFT_621710 [Schizopora paradoxa]|uniref:Uncharacterized protein n=1 Tax=Schizopora paradoxa TaxID=27342 RepID=A0A0H2R8E3_9AGAM|nr:hypothetical protein SCHPADRAFT_621710 [Schizopora paradoxa]
MKFSTAFRGGRLVHLRIWDHVKLLLSRSERRVQNFALVPMASMKKGAMRRAVLTNPRVIDSKIHRHTVTGSFIFKFRHQMDEKTCGAALY